MKRVCNVARDSSLGKIDNRRPIRAKADAGQRVVSVRYRHDGDERDAAMRPAS
jgi:hypothetical protein